MKERLFITPGLSPPTRGNRASHIHISSRTGSIPAHAGEPLRFFLPLGQVEVYPRPRGGTVLGA